MFYVLIDQARHCNYENKSQIFFNNTVPRLGGILSSYASNFHPAYLLYLASLYVEKKDNDIFFDMFKELVIDMMPKYEEILLNNLESFKENIFMTISVSTKDFKSSINNFFFKKRPNYKLVDDCMSYFSSYSKEYIDKKL